MSLIIIAAIALIGAVVPTILYINLVWWLDRYEKEPLPLLALAFLWGAIPAVLFVFIPELVFDQLLYALLGQSSFANALSFGLSPPFFEESAKGIFLVGLLFVFWKHFDDPLDGIVYGSMVGFGFAMTENLFYFLSTFAESGFGAGMFNIFLRAIVFGFNHAFFTSWTGLALGWARMHHGFVNRVVVPVLGWFTAMFFHSLHNLGATFAEATYCLSFLVAVVSDWGGVALMALIAFGIIGREHRWLVNELQPEVASGVLSQQEYEVLISSLRRAGARLTALLNQGWDAYHRLGQIYATATDLAFTKHQLSQFGEEGGNSQEIAMLRARLQKLRTHLTQ